MNETIVRGGALLYKGALSRVPEGIYGKGAWVPTRVWTYPGIPYHVNNTNVCAILDDNIPYLEDKVAYPTVE